MLEKLNRLAFSGITNYFNGRINAEKALTETRYQKEIIIYCRTKRIINETRTSSWINL